ncbi:MAG: YjaG family protein [Wenzhouxiangellaceae bacterium]
MVLSAFDGDHLKKRLGKLDSDRQLAFGAACCERLLPNYKAFQGDTGWGSLRPIRDALNLVWSSVGGQKRGSSEIRHIISECESVGPDSDDFESLYTSFAQDACFAVCSLLDYLLNSDAERIVQAATYATDSVDLFVQEIENMDPNDPELEQKIVTHPLMQRELAQQEKELQMIERASSLTPELLTQLRSAWDNNGKSNLDLP